MLRPDKVFSFRVLKPGAALPWPRMADSAEPVAPQRIAIDPADYRDLIRSMIGQCAAAGDPLNREPPSKRNTRYAPVVIAKVLRIGVPEAERLIAEMLIDGELEEYRELKGMRLRLPVDSTV